jgi:aerotaxis receptor
VKNLCKDGSHYWVYATVVPNVRRGETVGYTSVRRKPSRSKIADATTQYAQMKQDEEG